MISAQKQCLVFTMPQDIHSYAVGWALAKLGVTSRYFYTSDLPERAAIRFEIRGEGPAELELQCADGWATPSDRWCKAGDFSAAWFRRSCLPTFRPDLGDGDRDVALMDWSTVNQSVELILQSKIGFCLNPPTTRAGRNHKCYHLWLAATLGLRTPPSLITNDVTSIGRFAEAYSAGGSRCIAKPLHLPTWQGDSGRPHVFTTTTVCPADLQDSDLISDPVIFQQEVVKSFEVRVTKIGDEYLAVVINSQDTEKGRLDFRLHGDWRDFGHEPIEIPSEIMARLSKLCTTLKLIFCTIDFIVDEGSSWIFLEVNHMGNWLWIEAYNPKVRLLSRMAQMLARGRSDYAFDEDVDISFAPFLEEFEANKMTIAEQEARHHVRDARSSNVSDQ